MLELGSKMKPLIGSQIYLQNVKECGDWRGTLLEIRENAVVIMEQGKRKLVPFTSFLQLVIVDDMPKE